MSSNTLALNTICRRRTPAVWLACASVAVVLACKPTTEPVTPTPLVPTPPAGTVEHIEGHVEARRATVAAPTRALALRAPVWPDDTVTTGAEASVAIRLLHNGSLWELQGGQQRRVDQALAWTAARAVAPPVLADRIAAPTTAAAGRHSEQEAAQAAETAARPVAPAVARAAAPAAPPKYRKHTTQDFPAETVQGNLARPSAPGGGVGGLGLAGKVDPSAPAVNGGVQGSLSPEVVQKFLRPLRPQFAACYQKALQLHPDAAGRIVLHIAFGADGRVAVVEATSTTLPPEMGKCLEVLIKKQPRTRMHSVSVEVPLLFKPAE